jgi:hypothetical protein
MAASILGRRAGSELAETRIAESPDPKAHSGIRRIVNAFGDTAGVNVRNVGRRGARERMAISAGAHPEAPKFWPCACAVNRYTSAVSTVGTQTTQDSSTDDEPGIVNVTQVHQRTCAPLRSVRDDMASAAPSAVSQMDAQPQASSATRTGRHRFEDHEGTHGHKPARTPQGTETRTETKMGIFLIQNIFPELQPRLPLRMTTEAAAGRDIVSSRRTQNSLAHSTMHLQRGSRLYAAALV